MKDIDFTSKCYHWINKPAITILEEFLFPNPYKAFLILQRYLILQIIIYQAYDIGSAPSYIVLQIFL